MWNIDRAPLEKGKVYGAAIVLGGFISEDAGGHGFFNQHGDRFLETIRLKSSGQVSHIMVSGGNRNPDPKGFTESGYVKTVLRELNFPDSVILTEGKSRNTVENVKYTKEVLVSSHLQPPYVLVTSAFHMRRAMYIFKKNGLDVIPYSCDYINSRNELSWSDYLIPSVDALCNWSYYTKEFFGLAVAHIKS